MNQAVLLIISIETSILVGWLAWLSKTLIAIKVDVGSRSARQDTRLEDLERRADKTEARCDARFDLS